MKKLCLWNCAKVQDRLKSFFDKKTFDPIYLRGYVMVITLTTTLGEICAHKLIKQDVRANELPHYTLDTLIVIFSLIEAFIAPLISWWGYRRRQTTIISFSLIASASCLSWFFLPEAGDRQVSDLCDGINQENVYDYEGVTSRSITRLAIVSVSCIFLILARISCWSHGIAYTDEYSPERMSVHYGAILMSRVIVLILGDRLLTGVDSRLSFQIFVVGLVVLFAVNIVQVPFIMPKGAPVVNGVEKTPLPLEERSFLLSIGRVINNSVAMMQLFAMGLLAAALWGYGYHEIDIIKVKFNLLRETTLATGATEVLLYQFVIVGITYAGVKFSTPLTEFCKLTAIKNVIKLSILLFILHVIVTTITRCDRGEVVGITSGYYQPPACSLSCNCQPQWNEFKPVCAVNDMVTYVSPCQAGCADAEILNGIQVYSNCTCVPSGQVVFGACRQDLCTVNYNIYSVVFIIVITVTVLVFLFQGVLLLRVVDPRDKGVVMGMAWSVVAISAFVCGHLIFRGIEAATCAWYGETTCHLQDKSFPFYVGTASSIMVLLSTLISISSWISIRTLKDVANNLTTDVNN